MPETELTLSVVGRAMLGGGLIGGAAAVLILGCGRRAGMSGIVDDFVTAPRAAESRWRRAFLVGLVAVAVAASSFGPKTAASTSFGTDDAVVALVGGLLVGMGSRLGGGCTSGHGVCGLARGATRSLIAVAIFMTTAMATVFVRRVTVTGTP